MERLRICSFLIALSFFFYSCQKEDQFPTEHKVFWVNSSKLPCDLASPAPPCLWISEATELDDAIWEPFDFEITNFKFEVGFIYKINVLVTEKPAAPPGLSPIKSYQLDRVMLKEIDHALNFSGMYHAYFRNDLGEENEEWEYRKLMLFDSFFRAVYNSQICDSGSYSLLGVTDEEVKFECNTKSESFPEPPREPIPMEIEEILHKQLLSIRKYTLDGVSIELKNQDGKTVIFLEKTNHIPKN